MRWNERLEKCGKWSLIKRDSTAPEAWQALEQTLGQGAKFVIACRAYSKLNEGHLSRLAEKRKSQTVVSCVR